MSLSALTRLLAVRLSVSVCSRQLCDRFEVWPSTLLFLSTTTNNCSTWRQQFFAATPGRNHAIIKGGGQYSPPLLPLFSTIHVFWCLPFFKKNFFILLKQSIWYYSKIQILFCFYNMPEKKVSESRCEFAHNPAFCYLKKPIFME